MQISIVTKNKVQYFPILKWFYDISHKNKHVNFYLYKNTLNLEINLYTITALYFNMGNCDIIKSSISCIFLKTFKNKDNNFSVVLWTGNYFCSHHPQWYSHFKSIMGFHIKYIHLLRVTAMDTFSSSKNYEKMCNFPFYLTTSSKYMTKC